VLLWEGVEMDPPHIHHSEVQSTGLRCICIIEYLNYKALEVGLGWCKFGVEGKRVAEMGLRRSKRRVAAIVADVIDVRSTSNYH
jgi:hypothetical protein